VSFINVVSKIDLTITVGIIFSHNFVGDTIDIVTSPSTWAFSTDLGFTIKVTIIWTVFESPFVFNDNNTHVDFTSINLSVTVVVTFSKD